MASGIEKQVSQHLECAVCLERMKEPKVLTCQHTYCSKCLEGLLNRDGRRRDVFKIKCPECRKTTEVSGGEVKNLPNNLLVKKILSELDCSPSTKIPPCEKHEDEVLKLFCKDCDQLICRDCILIDHRDHHYKFVKDIYPAAKKKVEKVVDKAEEKINDLEAMVEKFDWLDTRAQESYQDASLEVDAFIDKHVAVLEKARKRMKGDLQKLYRNDNESRLKQRDALSASLQNLRKDVEFAKQTLKKGPPAEVLGTKKEIVERIGKVHTRDSARPNLITYHLEVAAPLNTENVVKKMAKVKRQVKECDADGEGDIFGGNDGAGYDEYEDYDGDVNESDMSEVSDLDDFEDDYEDEDDGLFGDCHVDDHGDCEVWDSVDELLGLC